MDDKREHFELIEREIVIRQRFRRIASQRSGNWWGRLLAWGISLARFWGLARRDEE